MSVVDELRFLCHWAALNGRFTFMPSSVLPGYRFRNWKIPDWSAAQCCASFVPATCQACNGRPVSIGKEHRL